MKRIWLFSFCLILLLTTCSEEKKVPQVGDWLAELQVSPSEVLPFNFSLLKEENGSYVMQMYNAEEVVTVDEIKVWNDSIQIQMPIFEGYVSGTFTENEINGSFIKESLDRIVPFTA